jgi:hypothetical protein
MLRAYGLVLSLILRPQTAACNNGAGGYTKRHVKSLTHLTEPQGKIKNREYVTGLRFGFIFNFASADSSLQQRRRRIYEKAREIINPPDRTAR